MKFSTLEAIFKALDRVGVRYLIAGGVAVNIHGYQRMTADLDLVVQLERDNIVKAMSALNSLGYRPIVPVTEIDFADADIRQGWVKSKNMKVLSFHADQSPETSVDIFVTEPFDFDKAYNAAVTAEINPELIVKVVSIPTLIKMKIEAGRPRDLDDVMHLEMIADETDT
jgi:uncharacterized protein (DUF1330 family)